jgi:HD superfamily phosphohydrolase
MPKDTNLRTERIRDPLHNLIEFAIGSIEFEEMLWRLIGTSPFQRLRRIKQLGFSDLVFPGACHSRFAHSLGVFFTARRLMEVIKRHVDRVAESKMTRALAASLVHDLGHGPFSHSFESVGERLGLRMANHEFVSDRVIRDSEVTIVLNSLGRGFADDVADIIVGAGEKNVYRAVVSSQFDADRLDYMRRDRLMTGCGYRKSHPLGLGCESGHEIGSCGTCSI